MELIDFMTVCETNDVAAVAEAMTQGWGVEAAAALASAQQWVPNFRGFMAKGALMGLYKDVNDGEQERAMTTLQGYFKLDPVSAASAFAAIQGT